MRGTGRKYSQRFSSEVEAPIARGHRFKVSGVKFKRDVRGKFFMQRVVDARNAVPGRWWKQAHS